MTTPDTAALALLREFQFAGDPDNACCRCPCCGNDEPQGHAPDCRLAAALSSAQSPADTGPIAASGGKPDGVMVDDAMVERACRAAVAATRPRADPDALQPAPRGQLNLRPLWQLYEASVRPALLAALTPAPSTEPEPRAGGPTL